MDENDSILDQISKNLSERGYNIRRSGLIYQAFHKTYWSFEFDRRGGGIMFQCFVRIENKIESERLALWVNDLNRDSTVSRFYIDEEGDFAYEAWWPYLYNKEAFDDFIGAWIKDGYLATRHPETGRIL